MAMEGVSRMGWRGVLLAVGSFVLFFGLHTFFDFREGGSAQNLGATRLAEPGFYVETFGAAWFYGSIVRNVALAGLSAELVVFAVRRFRERASGASFGDGVFGRGARAPRVRGVRVSGVCHARGWLARHDLLRGLDASHGTRIQSPLAAFARGHACVDDETPKDRAASQNA